MNRRRVVAGIISVTAVILGALFLPSLLRTSHHTSVMQPDARSSGAVADAKPPAESPAAAPSPMPSPNVTAEAAPLPPVPQMAVPPQDIDPHKAFGSRTAPIIMEIFSDYQCPSCKALFLNTNRQLMDNYVSTGKVYLIHRDFPLPMHAYSRVAARYVRAAAQLGKVEQAEQVLYENQEKWEQSGDVDGTVAGAISASDMAKVRALVRGGTMEGLIDKDYSIGQSYRVNQTPTTVFHCKGQTYPYSGAMSYDILKQFLEQLLSQK